MTIKPPDWFKRVNDNRLLDLDCTTGTPLESDPVLVVANAVDDAFERISEAAKAVHSGQSIELQARLGMELTAVLNKLYRLKEVVDQLKE